MLPLYSEQSRCVKCGAGGALSRFDGEPADGFMRRICARCGYAWDERPLDQATPEELVAGGKQKARDLAAAVRSGRRSS